MHLQFILLRFDVTVLAQKYRLQGKEVIFLSRKRQYFSAGLFGFFYRKQYAQIPYHQLSTHITIKYSKKSTQRNVLKRAIIQYVQEQKIPMTPIHNQYYKIFVVCNKSRIEDLQKKIANFTKKDIIKYIQKEFATAWKAFASRI